MFAFADSATDTQKSVTSRVLSEEQNPKNNFYYSSEYKFQYTAKNI